MIFRVTQKRINHGLLADCDSCPIALAIDAKSRGLAVSQQTIFNMHGEWKDLVRHTPEIEEWIKNFDQGNIVQPIEFHLSAEVFMQ